MIEAIVVTSEARRGRSPARQRGQLPPRVIVFQSRHRSKVVSALYGVVDASRCGISSRVVSKYSQLDRTSARHQIGPLLDMYEENVAEKSSSRRSSRIDVERSIWTPLIGALPQHAPPIRARCPDRQNGRERLDHTTLSTSSSHDSLTESLPKSENLTRAQDRGGA